MRSQANEGLVAAAARGAAHTAADTAAGVVSAAACQPAAAAATGAACVGDAAQVAKHVDGVLVQAVDASACSSRSGQKW